MPPALPPAALLEALRYRYATKHFDPARRIDAHTWSALEETLLLTPSSFGLQPWKFIVVRDKTLRERLVEHTWNQRQVADCSHLIVMAVRRAVDDAYLDRFIARIALIRNVDPGTLIGYRRVMAGAMGSMTTEWAARQAYLALGQFMLAASLVGVDTCPMEGFLPDKYDEILELTPRGLTCAVLCPAGYRAASDPYASAAKVRFDASEVIEHL